MERLIERSFESSKNPEIAGEYPDIALELGFSERAVDAIRRGQEKEFRDEEVGKFENLMRYMEGDK